MDRLIEYIQNRLERINSLKDIRSTDSKSYDNAINNINLELGLVGDKSKDYLKEIDNREELENYLAENLANLESGLKTRIYAIRENLIKRRSQLLKNIVCANVKDLIEYSDKIKASEVISASLSKNEKAILEFIESHNNYRLSLQYKNLEDVAAEGIKLRYNDLRKIGAKEVKSGLVSLINKGILDYSNPRSFRDMLVEIRERFYRLTDKKKELREIVEIIGIQEGETKDKILAHCQYNVTIERISELEQVLSANIAETILKDNPGLLLEDKRRFESYIFKLKEVIAKSSKEEIFKSIKSSLREYSSIDSLEFLNKKSEKKQNGHSYDLESVGEILNKLKSKKAIGDSYLPQMYIRNNITNKIGREWDFDSTIKTMISAGALIHHTKKGKTEAPISINPHTEEITDRVLREEVRRTLGYK